MMLASMNVLPNVDDPTPVNGWKRGPVKMLVPNPDGSDLPAFWAADAIVGFSCEYAGELRDGSYYIFRDCAYVVPADRFGNYRIEIMMVSERWSADGDRLERLRANGVDASYYRRASLYDAVREAEEAVMEDCRSGVPMLDQLPDSRLATDREEGPFKHYPADRAPLSDPLTSRPLSERIAERIRTRSSK